MGSPLSRRLLASTVAVATLLVSSALPISAADFGTLSGKVTDNDGITPRAGVVIALVDDTTKTIIRSEPTNDQGVFRIGEAPVGDYKLLAETDNGAFLASNQFDVQAGSNRPVALKLQPADTIPNATIAPGQNTGAGGTSWWQWVIAGTIAVVGLVVVADASDESNASPMFPPTR